MTAAPDFDPLQERSERPHRCRVHVLGAEFAAVSNDRRLIDFVDQAFARLPAHDLGTEPPSLVVDLVLSDGPSSCGDDPPPLQFRSGAGLIVGAFDASNYAVVSADTHSALVAVSRELLAHPYRLRYELIEFAFLMLALRAQALVPLHAACVGSGNRGVLLSGPSGAGKSLLSLACMLRGLELVAEDGVYISPDQMLAIGCPNFIHLRKDSVRYLDDPRFVQAIQAAPVIRRRSGAYKFELDVRSGPYALASEPVRITSIVQLSSQHAKAGKLLTPCSSQDAVAALEDDRQYAMVLPQWPRLRERLLSVPAYRLDRPAHPEQAADALAELLAAGSR